MTLKSTLQHIAAFTIAIALLYTYYWLPQNLKQECNPVFELNFYLLLKSTIMVALSFAIGVSVQWLSNKAKGGLLSKASDYITIFNYVVVLPALMLVAYVEYQYCGELHVIDYLKEFLK